MVANKKMMSLAVAAVVAVALVQVSWFFFFFFIFLSRGLSSPTNGIAFETTRHPGPTACPNRARSHVHGEKVVSKFLYPTNPRGYGKFRFRRPNASAVEPLRQPRNFSVFR